MNSGISLLKLSNFGPIRHCEWSNLGNLNLVMAPNGQGKTFVLKSLYAAVKTLEEYQRGDADEPAEELLRNKLKWTFQADDLPDLITKRETEAHFKAVIDGNPFVFRIPLKSEGKRKLMLEWHGPNRSSRCIYLPAKEVMSAHRLIISYRQETKRFGFDDTYFDLANALMLETTKGRNYAAFTTARNKLKDLLKGRAKYSHELDKWKFQANDRAVYDIGVMSEGIKKLAILDTLLGNRYLDDRSILFIDEPESALHPSLISSFMDILYQLSKQGLQIIMASHSYFVVKKLYLIAQKEKYSIPVLSFGLDGWTSADFRDGMLDNPIIDESIRLYEDEIDIALP